MPEAPNFVIHLRVNANPAVIDMTATVSNRGQADAVIAALQYWRDQLFVTDAILAAGFK